ncbi:DsrE family protein [Roseateles sp. NT4]|uniref:DsrE family protein n=1 Tax=Roseateles sp. NT4 TaxID=3453715 RepID=UPI003EEB233E
MRFLRLMFAALLLSFSATYALAQQHVVYHFDDAPAQAMKGLRNIRNHLDGDPTAQITVVALGPGVDVLMPGYKDANASDYAAQVTALKARGVKFEVCENTMKGRNLKKEQFLPEVDYTPAGVVRLAKLQGQGFAYIKP